MEVGGVDGKKIRQVVKETNKRRVRKKLKHRLKKIFKKTYYVGFIGKIKLILSSAIQQ